MSALVTVAVPTLNQGRFLGDALESIFRQEVPVEVFVADGGSTDNTLDVIRHWAPRLAGWRSEQDLGQSAAINACIRQGQSPFVMWLNSDDLLLDGGLCLLLSALEGVPRWPMVYGQVWNADENLQRTSHVFTRAFCERLMANLNIISQPGTLIRRSVWESVGGVDESLHMALDYDLWWRIYIKHGAPGYIPSDVAINRNHGLTKTRTRRKQHYQEAIHVVRRHYGSVPWKWWLAWPLAVWGRSLLERQEL